VARARIVGTSLSLIVCAALVAAVAQLGQSTASAVAPTDYGTVLNILPPGQSGTITAADAAKVIAGDPQGRVAVDGVNAPPNFADQLEMYDRLNTVDPSKISETDLTRYYKPATFDLPAADITRSETPKDGVTIAWDTHGVPHVNGATHSDVAYGAGYAGDARPDVPRGCAPPCRCRPIRRVPRAERRQRRDGPGAAAQRLLHPR
jgi:hypothetical protein